MTSNATAAATWLTVYDGASSVEARAAAARFYSRRSCFARKSAVNATALRAYPPRFASAISVSTVLAGLLLYLFFFSTSLLLLFLPALWWGWGPWRCLRRCEWRLVGLSWLS